MLQYIAKRLLLMVVTLFGITVITFVVTRLAPGDPAAMKVQGIMMGAGAGRGQLLSEAIIEDNRRILGLDKPIVFNVDPMGRSRHVRKQIGDLGSFEEYLRNRAQTRLREWGTIAIPTSIEALEEGTSETVRRRLLDLLPGLAKTTPPADVAGGSMPRKEEWWRTWWTEHRTLFEAESVERAVAAYLTEPTEAGLRRVVQIGGFAVPVLMRRIGSRNTSVAEHATAALASIIGRPWSNLDARSAEVHAKNLYRWRNWWRYHRAEYVEFGPVERFVRRFTDTQFGVWFGKILKLDFDESYVHHRPVLEIIAERLPISVQLALISIFLSYFISIPLGIFSATHQFSLRDKVVTVVLFLLYSLPSFWVADMLILFVTERPGGHLWEFFPTQGLYSLDPSNYPLGSWLLDRLWHLVLPITCLTYASFAFLSRQMRVAMLETVRQDFIRTAQAKGLSQRAVIFKHALRNSVIPILTLMASLLPELLGGSLIIESIFGIEGMGKLTIDSILNRDYAVINAIAFFSAFLTLLGILLSDLSYALVDPRIRYE